MEKIRLKNGNEYDVIPGGFQMTDGQGGCKLLRMILVQKEGMSFDTVEADFSQEENLSTIRLLDPNHTAENAVSGYTILKSVEKSSDYLIGHNTRQLEGGGCQMDEIRGTVYVILLAQPDFQTQFDSLKETVEAMVLSALEV